MIADLSELARRCRGQGRHRLGAAVRCARGEEPADAALRAGPCQSTIAKLEGRIRELQESPTLGFTTFLDTAQINALERKLEELRRARDQTQARIAFLEGPPDTGAPAAPFTPAPDDTAGAKERAKNLERIARELEGTLFSITHEGSARIIAEHERRVAEIETLRARTAATPSRSTS